MTGHKFRRPDSECISHAELKRRFEYVGKSGLRRKNGSRGKTGNVKTTGYVRVSIDHKSYFMHRLVWFYHKKKWPVELNHIDRDKLNCAIDNLEECSRKENQTHAMGRRCAAFIGEKKVAEFDSLIIAAAWASVGYWVIAKAIEKGHERAGHRWGAA